VGGGAGTGKRGLRSGLGKTRKDRIGDGGILLEGSPFFTDRGDDRRGNGVKLRKKTCSYREV